MTVFYTETCQSCLSNFNANLKLFLSLSNCASVGRKTVIKSIIIHISFLLICLRS